MKGKLTFAVMAGGMALAIAFSNIGSFIDDGKELDSLRENVLRLHILANSDSDNDQRLKLCVRDALLEHSEEIFGGAESFEEARRIAEDKLELAEEIAVKALAENDCNDSVTAEVTEMYFDERTYDDITMPAGEYSALRIKIGEAEGHNWWCVMYPALCIPAAGNETAQECFTDQQQDIIYHPAKYRVRFAVWDKIKEWMD